MKVINYNTHLFGDALTQAMNTLSSLPPFVADLLKTLQQGTLQFADSARAKAIMNHLRSSEADIVGLTEVWDNRLASLIQDSLSDLYHFSFRAGEASFFSGTVLGSGLLLLSKFPLRQAQFAPFDDLTGLDRLSTKGTIRAIVDLPGGVPPLALLLAHTQADSDSEAVHARHANLVQMQMLAGEYKLNFPKSSVLLLGDLNVTAETADGSATDEYRTITSLFGRLGLQDVFRQLHPSASNDPGITYDGVNNSLIRVFSPSDASTRQRLDYQFLLPNNASTLRPDSLVVSSDFRSAAGDLSDHYPLIGDYSLQS